MKYLTATQVDSERLYWFNPAFIAAIVPQPRTGNDDWSNVTIIFAPESMRHHTAIYRVSSDELLSLVVTGSPAKS